MTDTPYPAAHVLGSEGGEMHHCRLGQGLCGNKEGPCVHRWSEARRGTREEPEGLSESGGGGGGKEDPGWRGRGPGAGTSSVCCGREEDAA